MPIKRGGALAGRVFEKRNSAPPGGIQAGGWNADYTLRLDNLFEAASGPDHLCGSAVAQVMNRRTRDISTDLKGTTPMATKNDRRGVNGVVSVIPIPFGENEEIDEKALRGLIDFAAACKVGAVCLPAYGSEFYKLSDEERARVVRIAVEQAAGRLLVIGQSNHGSSRLALRMAMAHVKSGADLISIAIPRQFALSDEDLLRYLSPVLNGVDVPCLVQDFNPGGPTISVEFARRLRAECSNLRYLKLEEALAATKVAGIGEVTHGEVGVLEGWGGLYMMELMPAGICGLMPGLGMADLLQLIFDLRKEHSDTEAFRLYEKVLPHIVFSLQNMELYLYCEKSLLRARGLLSNAHCRNASLSPDPFTIRYVDELNQRVVHALEDVGFSAAGGRI